MAGEPAIQTHRIFADLPTVQRKCDNRNTMVSIGNIGSSHTALIEGVVVAVFVVSWIVLLVVTPIVIASLPEDYFSSPKHLEAKSVFTAGIPPARRLLLFLKNGFAWFLILIAPFLFLSIFAPFFGFLLADFPAKPRLIRKFASFPLVWHLLNRVRERRGLPPFTDAVQEL